MGLNIINAIFEIAVPLTQIRLDQLQHQTLAVLVELFAELYFAVQDVLVDL